MQPVTDIAARRMATAYHETLGEFRGELVTTALDFGLMQGPVPQDQSRRLHGSSDGRALRLHARRNPGVADREFGPEIAGRLAFIAAEILMNGDSEDRNADITAVEREA